MRNYINKKELNAILNSEHKDPHHFLGQHTLEDGSAYINVYQPYAKSIKIINVDTGERIKMEEFEDSSVYTVQTKKPINYKISYKNYEGHVWEGYDPYSFEKYITEFDCHLFAQGTHYEIFDKMGAHVINRDGVEGVLFAVWAPNAKRVSVIGDFCGWDGRILPMRSIGGSGIFELFVPGIKENERYKFEIKTNEGMVIEKSDPYANYSELRPNTASVVWNMNEYNWNDADWIEEKASKDTLNQPISIYEVHLGSWKQNDSETGFINYRELAHQLVEYVTELGYTHIQLMPVAEHPFDGSWGYQVTGLFAPTSRFGTPDEFMYFVDYCHQNNIAVLVDWVPAHFPKDNHGLIKFDGSALYEHADAKQGEHPHWGTLIYNYGRNEVKNFLISNAIFWLERFHIDGLRVDAVASMLYLDYGKESGEWIPNPHGGRENMEAVEFFKHLNSILYERNPHTLMIAEESTAWPGVSRPTNIGGLGFGLKWNMGWMNDFLRYVEKEAIHKKYHHNDLTFSLVYAFTENFTLVLSHDEVVHGKGSMINKMPGDYWQKFANLRAAYGFMYGHPGKKLLFMGGEFAQFDEWAEDKSLDWHLLEFEKHSQMKKFNSDLNKVYRNEPALWEQDFVGAGFAWINCNDAEESMVSFARMGNDPNSMVIVVSNFTPVPRNMHRVGVPLKGKYVELINSDNLAYGGSGVINSKPLYSNDIPWDNMGYSIDIKVPPLGTCILKYYEL